MAILGLGTPSANASSGCDSAEAVLLASFSGSRHSLPLVKQRAEAYKKCLSGYADSYSSSNIFAGGTFFSLFTDSRVIENFNSAAKKALADFRMALLSEPSTINWLYSLSDCNKYDNLIGYRVNGLASDLMSKGMQAQQQCRAMFQVKNDRAKLVVQSLESGYTILAWANWPTDVQLSYAWYRGTEQISGQRDKQYVLTNQDIGSTISVKVTGSRYGLTPATHTSPPSGIVKQSTSTTVVPPNPTPVETPKPVVAPTPTPAPVVTPKPVVAPTPTPTPVVTPKPVVAPTPTPTPVVAPTPTAAVNQATLTISSAFTRHLASSTQWAGLSTTGGSGTGAVTYSASGTGCSVSGQLLKSEIATTCIVIATKAASNGYNAITSAPQRF